MNDGRYSFSVSAQFLLRFLNLYSVSSCNKMFAADHENNETFENDESDDLVRGRDRLERR